MTKDIEKAFNTVKSYLAKQENAEAIDGRLFHAPISWWEKYDDMWTEKLKKSNKMKNLKGIYDFLSIEQIEEAQREMDKYILEMMKKYEG